jgi:NAD(P)-dependent dehydrogenase (short-subunit alcohol dehydrogenase family)
MGKLFEGKRAFVTGGGSGIGRACALALAAEGCFVTVAGRTQSTLNDTVRSIVEAGGSAQATTCDVTIESMVQSAVAAAAGDEGRLDVAVNSAGYDGSAAMPTSEWTGEMLDEMLTSNVRGTFLPMKYELEVMHRQGSGAIVNIGSGAGLLGVPGHSGYVASKHAGVGLTRSAALEYAPRGIRINAICPGTIETPMVTDMITKGELNRADAAAATPMARLGRADEVAASVLWLCSPGAGFVVGVALPVDGGYTAQ